MAGGKPLPRLWLVTDPARTPDPEALASRLPRGAGIIFRAFGAADATEQGLRLRRIAWRRGLVLLVGADPALARACRADGVHLPERMACQARALKRAQPRWRITAAAHSPAAARAADRAGCEAALVSPVFASNSPSAGRPIGRARLAALVRAASLPVVALGGVNAKTARGLSATGVAGLAMVEGLSEALRT